MLSPILIGFRKKISKFVTEKIRLNRPKGTFIKVLKCYPHTIVLK